MESDVVIVGGGLTGLSLARRLDEAHIDYLLLEARDRFGGRILSQGSDNSSYPTVRHDLGPSWIWPGQPRIESLIREFNLTPFQQHSEGTLVYEETDGTVRRDLNYSTMAGSLRIGRGMASITDAIVGVLDRQKLLLSHTVTRIARNKGGFRLAATTVNGEETIRARRVVIAAPPRVIESTMTFDPPLPDNAVNALREVPTWMAGQAKLVATYDQPFWRHMGLNGDGISRRGPLVEIHDATPASDEMGALFGFVGIPVGLQQRERSSLIDVALPQLEAMYGQQASNPVDIIIKDWANDRFTATTLDKDGPGHPQHATPVSIAGLVDEGLMFATSEMGPQFGGLLEGALEASEAVARRIVAVSGRRSRT